MMNKILIPVILLTVLLGPALARAELTRSETERLTKAKALLMDAEPRSLEEIVAEFERIGSARDQLTIYEAIAATFRDIQDEYGHESLDSKEQLLGKIRLNMAYFQLGGPTGESKGMGELNRLIRRKLKHYLPKEIWNNSRLFHSLE